MAEQFIKVILTGDEFVDQQLRLLPQKLQKKAIRKATRAAAKEVLADARQRVPVDEGNLEKSLTVRTAKRRNGKSLGRHAFGHAVVTRGGMFQGDEFYGGFIEFGTQLRFTKSGQARGQIEPESFMRWALYGNEQRIKQIFRTELLRAVQEIAREAARDQMARNSLQGIAA